MIKFVGAGYLVYLGIQAIRHRRHTAVTHEATPPRRSRWRILSEGFVVGLTNPKSLVFFVAVLPQFVDYRAGAIPLQLFELGLVFLVLALIFDSIWALAAGTARQWFGRSPKTGGAAGRDGRRADDRAGRGARLHRRQALTPDDTDGGGFRRVRQMSPAVATGVSTARASEWKCALKPRTGGRRLRVEVEMLDVERVHDDVVVVGAGSGRRSGTGEALRPELVREHRRALREVGAALRARVRSELRDGGGDVVDGPVPESRAGRCVRVVDGHGEALRLRREAGPGQRAERCRRRRRRRPSARGRADGRPRRRRWTG